MAKRILVIDPIPTHRIGVVAELERAQYEVISVARPRELVEVGGEFDLVILGTSGEDPARAVAALPVAKSVPILCLDNEAGPMRRLFSLRAGAREMLHWRTSKELLLARLRLLIREAETKREQDRRRATAICFGMDDAPSPFQAVRRIGCLGKGASAYAEIIAGITGYAADAFCQETALREAESCQVPDAFVLSIAEGEGDRLDQLLPELRDRNHSRYTPVMVLYPANMPDLATRAMNLGASEIASVESSGEELALRLAGMIERKELKDRLRQTVERSYHMAATDPLTELFNRRYAEAYLADVAERAESSGRDFAAMMIDLDHFKQVNDTYGHGVGDQVLKTIASRIRENLRAVDLVARMGGEEFLVVLPDTDEREAKFASERLRRLVSDRPVDLTDGEQISVTASFGVAMREVEMAAPRLRTGTFDLPEGMAGPMQTGILERADAALYKAKAAGRNRIEFSASAD